MIEFLMKIPWRKSLVTEQDAWACVSSSQAQPEDLANQYHFEEPIKPRSTKTWQLFIKRNHFHISETQQQN